MYKYKLTIFSIVMLLVGFLCGFAIAAKNLSAVREVEEVQVLNGEEKSEVKDFGKPALIYFFGMQCSSCQKFKPIWVALKKKYKDKFNFIEINVDVPKNAPLCYEFMVNIIPVVHIEDVKFRNRAMLNPAEYAFVPRLYDDLDRYLEMREILKKGAVL